ncbi:DUF6928 family protein [Streptomyces albidoflavus]|uniref:DUF6928 family protein n=1 Tax=Streptomyces albidoflavus TaxID=1886 RepID=UPI00365CEDA4
MGAKTALLMYADGAIPGLLRHAGPPDPERTSALVRRSYPHTEIEPCQDSNLSRGIYPPGGRAYAGSWPGLDVLTDRRLMTDTPSHLPEHLVSAGAGRRLVLHAMHSVVDWLAFAVWEDGHLLRSLSLSPDRGVIENIGTPLPFEQPYWSGDRPADVIPRPDEDEEPYPLPFHPLELGEEALRSLYGFVQEGYPEPDDVDAATVRLLGLCFGDGAIPPHSL